MLQTITYGDIEKPEKSIGLAKFGNHFISISRTEKYLENFDSKGKFSSFIYYSITLIISP